MAVIGHYVITIWWVSVFGFDIHHQLRLGDYHKQKSNHDDFGWARILLPQQIFHSSD